MKAGALLPLTLICVLSLLHSGEAQRNVFKRRSTTTVAPTTQAQVQVLEDEGEVEGVQQSNEERDYHPAEVQKPRLIERHDMRHLDGHYEYRYVLSNGDTRYERAYWLPVGNKMVLARKGYFSYPLPNKEFLTVFYTADHNGYQQDSSTFTRTQPTLPRSLDVPAHEAPELTIWRTATTATTQSPRKSTITRRRKVTSTTARAPPHISLARLAMRQEADATTTTTATAKATEALASEQVINAVEQQQQQHQYQQMDLQQQHKADKPIDTDVELLAAVTDVAQPTTAAAPHTPNSAENSSQSGESNDQSDSDSDEKRM